MERAESLDSAFKFLEKFEQKVKNYENAPLFPGIKSIKDYDIFGLKGTPEQKIHENLRLEVIAFWKERPEILRKHNKAKRKKKIHD